MRHQWKHKVDILESTIEGKNDDEVTFVNTVILCHWKGTIKGITNSDLTSKKACGRNIGKEAPKAWGNNANTVG